MEQIRELITCATSATDREKRIEAYGQIVERFRDMACGYAYSILGDFHLAEDAAQDAFVNAFYKLDQLRQPQAFPGWFRRIVWSACGRISRRKEIPTESLETVDMKSESDRPDELVARNELRNEVLKAIRSLPKEHREVTTLFYINGYSQKDISDFLEVSVTTVKNRLSASRSRLKERMLIMVKDTLHKNAPDERFDRKVIDDLLSRPRPLEMVGHPVRTVWDAIQRALPDYEVVEGDEVVDRDTQMTVSGAVGYAFPDEGKVLRTSTTVATFRAMTGRKPPVRIMTAGRVFRGSGKDAVEDRTHLKVFHQADILCIDEGLDRQTMRGTVRQVMEAVFETSGLELRWDDENYPLFVQGAELSVKMRGAQVSVAGTGMLSAATLKQAGYDPEKVSCFAFGLGLERLAMLKLGLDDIRKLWQPPYVT